MRPVSSRVALEHVARASARRRRSSTRSPSSRRPTGASGSSSRAGRTRPPRMVVGTAPCARPSCSAQHERDRRVEVVQRGGVARPAGRRSRTPGASRSSRARRCARRSRSTARAAAAASTDPSNEATSPSSLRVERDAVRAHHRPARRRLQRAERGGAGRARRTTGRAAGPTGTPRPRLRVTSMKADTLGSRTRDPPLHVLPAHREAAARRRRGALAQADGPRRA